MLKVQFAAFLFAAAIFCALPARAQEQKPLPEDPATAAARAEQADLLYKMACLQNRFTQTLIPGGKPFDIDNPDDPVYADCFNTEAEKKRAALLEATRDKMAPGTYDSIKKMDAKNRLKLIRRNYCVAVSNVEFQNTLKDKPKYQKFTSMMMSGDGNPAQKLSYYNSMKPMNDCIAQFIDKHPGAELMSASAECNEQINQAFIGAVPIMRMRGLTSPEASQYMQFLTEKAFRHAQCDAKHKIKD